MFGVGQYSERDQQSPDRKTYNVRDGYVEWKDNDQVYESALEEGEIAEESGDL